MGLKGRVEYVKALRQSTVEGTNNLGESVVEAIKKETPVDTGRLLRGWEYIPATESTPPGHIVNDVPYAPYVNDGTPTHAARNMVEKGLATVDRDFRRYLRRVSR